MNSGKTGGPLFGTGIVPVSAKSSPNQAGIECIAKLGSGHMELLKALKNPKVRGVVIRESVPYPQQDAAHLQKTYRQLP